MATAPALSRWLPPAKPAQRRGRGAGRRHGAVSGALAAGSGGDAEAGRFRPPPPASVLAALLRHPAPSHQPHAAAQTPTNPHATAPTPRPQHEHAPTAACAAKQAPPHTHTNSPPSFPWKMERMPTAVTRVPGLTEPTSRRSTRHIMLRGRSPVGTSSGRSCSPAAGAQGRRQQSDGAVVCGEAVRRSACHSPRPPSHPSGHPAQPASVDPTRAA